jgi:hypothetical protein
MVGMFFAKFIKRNIDSMKEVDDERGKKEQKSLLINFFKRRIL